VKRNCPKRTAVKNKDSVNALKIEKSCLDIDYIELNGKKFKAIFVTGSEFRLLVGRF
jgi:hypothetical protein